MEYKSRVYIRVMNKINSNIVPNHIHHAHFTPPYTPMNESDILSAPLNTRSIRTPHKH